MGEVWDESEMVQLFHSDGGPQAWGEPSEELAETMQESWNMRVFHFPRPLIQLVHSSEIFFLLGGRKFCLLNLLNNLLLGSNSQVLCCRSTKSHMLWGSGLLASSKEPGCQRGLLTVWRVVYERQLHVPRFHAEKGFPGTQERHWPDKRGNASASVESVPLFRKNWKGMWNAWIAEPST